MRCRHAVGASQNQKLFLGEVNERCYFFVQTYKLLQQESPSVREEPFKAGLVSHPGALLPVRA